MSKRNFKPDSVKNDDEELTSNPPKQMKIDHMDTQLNEAIHDEVADVGSSNEKDETKAHDNCATGSTYPEHGLEGDTVKTVESESSPLSEAADKALEIEGTFSADKSAENLEPGLPDPLSYTQAEEFTSEIFKIQIHNLPKFGFNQLKKRLVVSLGLKPHKLKSPNKHVTYVCFKNDIDRQDALKKINGHVWKGRTLEAKEAAPIADPFLQKKQEQNSAMQANDEIQYENHNEVLLDPFGRKKTLKASVVPLLNMEYSEQLKLKMGKMKAILRKMAQHHFLLDQYHNKEGWQWGDLACPLLTIIPSPVTSNYRNKNEFTIGFGLDGITIKVGFRYGMYKNGSTAVGDCLDFGIALPAAIPVVKSFQKFVAASKWSPFLQQKSTGHWQTLMVRTFQSGDVMAMVDFVPRKLEQAEIEEAKMSVSNFYTTGKGKGINITSFYFRLCSKEQRHTNSYRLEHIFGKAHVFENLMGLKFRISPEAFFQVNTQATECLYRLIEEWIQVSPSTTVLDICCGTGTIGLSLAKKAKQVIGIEMCKPAVEDAKENAALNGISNVTFYCRKVEDIISRIVSSVTSSSSSQPPSSSPSSPDAAAAAAAPTASNPNSDNIVAVVDPPRAGLHKNVIKSLRKCQDVCRMVYVSCNPEGALQNFIDLVRPATGKHKGHPFTLVKAVPVDLFPGTSHCELVLLFTREVKSKPVIDGGKESVEPTLECESDVNIQA